MYQSDNISEPSLLNYSLGLTFTLTSRSPFVPFSDWLPFPFIRKWSPSKTPLGILMFSSIYFWSVPYPLSQISFRGNLIVCSLPVTEVMKSISISLWTSLPFIPATFESLFSSIAKKSSNSFRISSKLRASSSRCAPPNAKPNGLKLQPAWSAFYCSLLDMPVASYMVRFSSFPRVS